ncbi:MAG: hypothetical protein ABS965_00345, partial [Succiniclasticum sp.]
MSKHSSRKKSFKQKLAVTMAVVNVLNMGTPLVLPYVNMAGQVPAAGGQIVQFADTAQSVFYGTAQAGSSYEVPPDSTVGEMNSGDTMTVSSGGTGTVTTMNSGTQVVYNGGVGTVTTMYGNWYSDSTHSELLGGVQKVSSGGTGTVE